MHTSYPHHATPSTHFEAYHIVRPSESGEFCSNPEDESHHLNELRTHFKERNYDPKITEDAITRAKEKPRSRYKSTKSQRPTFTPRGGGGGGHSQTNVLPTRVQTPQKWTLNGVLRHIKWTLNGVLRHIKWTLNGVLRPLYGTSNLHP